MRRNVRTNRDSLPRACLSRRLVTAAEHENRIKEILHNQWTFYRLFAAQNVMIDDAGSDEEDELIKRAGETGLLPDGRPVGWANDKRYWHLLEEESQGNFAGAGFDPAASAKPQPRSKRKKKRGRPAKSQQ